MASPLILSGWMVSDCHRAIKVPHNPQVMCSLKQFWAVVAKPFNSLAVTQLLWSCQKDWISSPDRAASIICNTAVRTLFVVQLLIQPHCRPFCQFMPYLRQSSTIWIEFVWEGGWEIVGQKLFILKQNQWASSHALLSIFESFTFEGMLQFYKFFLWILGILNSFKTLLDIQGYMLSLSVCHCDG